MEDSLLEIPEIATGILTPINSPLNPLSRQERGKPSRFHLVAESKRTPGCKARGFNLITRWASA